jgi:hypothetical protein
MTDSDDRTEVTISKTRMGMYDKEEKFVTLKSKSEDLDTLIKKAKESLL